MKEFFINITKLVLSILIIFFLEEYFFKFIGFIGLHIAQSSMTTLVIYLIDFVLIYIIYKEEIKSAFSKFQNKFGSNILYTLIAFIVVFMSMMITNYIVKLIADNLNITYSGLNITNIFDNNFNIDLIVLFIKDMVVIPFVKVIIFVLGINNLVKGKFGIFISSLSYALYEGFLIGGEFGYIFIDVIDEFILFLILSYIYKKNNNIAFSIVTFMLYEIFAGLLVTKIM